MFTGLVQGLGEIISASRINNERRLAIRPLFPMPDIEDGESIAINGACLSVEKHSGDLFECYASAETLAHTNLGQLAPGDKANLERALEAGQRIGGHIMSGHVDCLATVALIQRAGLSLRVRANFPKEYGAQVISKGSVALDGISLTVNACGPDFLEVNIIPDSRKRTNVQDWRRGSQLNMETDIIGKYVASLLRPWERNAISHEFLSSHGFA